MQQESGQLVSVVADSDDLHVHVVLELGEEVVSWEVAGREWWE